MLVGKAAETALPTPLARDWLDHFCADSELMTRGGRRAHCWSAGSARSRCSGFYVQQNLTISGDLRLFMPSPKTRIERLLLEEVGESPASRLLLVVAGRRGAGDAGRKLAGARGRAARRPAVRAGVQRRGLARRDSRDRCCPIAICCPPTLDQRGSMRRIFAISLSERLQDLSSPAAACSSR